MIKYKDGHIFDNGIQLLYRTNKRTKHRNSICIFRCFCGNKYEHPFFGGNNPTSCGCAIRHNQLNPGDSLYNSAASKIISHAKKRGINFEISTESVVEIMKKPCTYCGNIGGNTTTNNQCIVKNIQYNGIDRIDSNLGYIQGNCVPCCKYCNWAKNSLSVDDFKKHIILIYNHLNLGVRS